ncbi:hypothetical protein ACFUC1_08935 [Pedococcus sp. NPDC057267]|uniref:hypothetical protein n=1 Tax=Pedococcus sp. NPDC057267 TaxID=3346077 RepID=UPI00363948FB
MNVPESAPAAADTDPTRGLAQRSATVITELWAQDGPPMTGPVRMWEPERVLEVSGRVHAAWPQRPRGRFATAAVQRLLGTVIGYSRLLHPPLGWSLVPAAGNDAPSAPALLVWRNDQSGDVVADILRTPVQCAPLLDHATQQAVAQWDGAAAATRVVHLSAPRRTHVQMNGRSHARFDLHPERVWDELTREPALAVAVESRTGVA